MCFERAHAQFERPLKTSPLLLFRSYFLFVWHFNCWGLSAMHAPMNGAMAKLNWAIRGLVEFTRKQISVRRKCTHQTYNLTPPDKKKGIVNIESIKAVQISSETNVGLNETGKKWTLNLGGIFRDQEIPIICATAVPPRRGRRVSVKSLAEIKDIDETKVSPPSQYSSSCLALGRMTARSLWEVCDLPDLVVARCVQVGANSISIKM